MSKIILLTLLLTACGCADFEYTCFEGKVYYKQHHEDQFWTKTGKECR